MHLQKLTTALQAFSEPQFKRLKEYVHSPYFKVPSAAVSLFNYLYPLYPSFPEKKLETKPIARKTGNLSTYAAQRTAATALLHAIEQFIGLEHQLANPAVQILHQLHGFHELGLFQHFHNDYTPAVEYLNQCPHQHSDTFYHRHLFNELNFNARDLNRTNNTPSDITPAVTSLDEFYALKKLHYLLEAHLRNQINEAAFPAKQTAALLKTLQPYNNPKYPCAYLFINCYHLLNSSTYRQSLHYYNLLKEYARLNDRVGQTAVQSEIRNPKSEIFPPLATHYSPLALMEALHYIIRHLLHWYNKGVEQAGKEYLWWVEIKMEYGWFLNEGKLPPVTFRNILQIAVQHKTAEWMEEFIAVCEPYLPHETRPTNISFAKGLLSYRKKECKEAYRYFLMTQTTDQPLFNCVIRRWQWMCSYECDCHDSESLQNQLRSFKKYLNKNKEELGKNKESLDRFILYASKLLAAHLSQLSSSILRDVENESHFPGKQWLIKQVDLKKQTQPRKKATLAVPINA